MSWPETAAVNVFFASTRARGHLEPLRFDVPDDEMRFGAGTVKDMTWKQTLDTFSCTECGRCQDVCPAWTTGKELSPKLLIMALRDQVFAEGPALVRTPDGEFEDSGETALLLTDDPEALWKEILAEVDGDVSLETTEPDADPMYKQGLHLAQMGPNAVVKVPMTPDGLEAGKRLVADGIRINVTLVFSPGQAILAAEIGAYIVSPFLGRIDDAAADGMHALRQICEIYDIQGYDTNVLAASLRHPMHVVDSAMAGADIATMPFDVFVKLVKHPLTDVGLQKFAQDWQALQRNLKGGA